MTEREREREREINLTNPVQISHNQQPFWPLLALISKFSSLPDQKYGSPRFEKQQSFLPR